MHACDFFTCVYVCTRDPSPTEMSVEPWASTRDQAAAKQTHSLHDPPSQDQDQDQETFPDKVCVDSFWHEVETIQRGSGDTDLDSCRRDSRHSEGNDCRSASVFIKSAKKEQIQDGVCVCVCVSFLKCVRHGYHRDPP